MARSPSARLPLRYTVGGCATASTLTPSPRCDARRTSFFEKREWPSLSMAAFGMAALSTGAFPAIRPAIGLRSSNETPSGTARTTKPLRASDGLFSAFGSMRSRTPWLRSSIHGCAAIWLRLRRRAALSASFSWGVGGLEPPVRRPHGLAVAEPHCQSGGTVSSAGRRTPSCLGSSEAEQPPRPLNGAFSWGLSRRGVLR
jgi:hypothetical protein